MKRMMCVLLAGVMGSSSAAMADEAPANDEMSQRDRVSYAVGYELGQRLSEKGVNVSPEQVAAGIREGNSGDDDLAEEVPGVGFRLGQMIAARGLTVSPSVVAEAIKDGMTGDVALLDADARGAALTQATAGPYAKVQTEVDDKVDGRVNEARPESRGGYGLWSTPVPGSASGGVGAAASSGGQRSDLRVSPSGRIEAGVNTQRVQAGVAGTAVNNEEVDAFAPVPGEPVK